jgi:hypothetical protein
MKNIPKAFTFISILLPTFIKAQTGNIGIGTNNPQARLQLNHKSTANIPSFLILDSINGKGGSIQFGQQNQEGRFGITGNSIGPDPSRGLILSWIDDSLLWIKQDGRMGLGTGNPQARMQVNHKSTPNSPSFLILDSLNGKGGSIQFGQQNQEGRFGITGNSMGPDPSRGLILSWLDDSLLWIKQDGRMGLGTGNPQARMQVNHKSTPNSPSFLILDSLNGKGGSIQFGQQNQEGRFGITGNGMGPDPSRGLILSWLDDSLLWIKQDGRMGLGTGNPQARMQVNHKSSPNTPSFLILDSMNGKGGSIQFGQQNHEGRFGITGNSMGPDPSRGLILSWLDDSLLWIKQDGRMGLGTGNPFAKMQINHKSTNLLPHFILLDSSGGLGSMLAFRKQGIVKDLRITGIPGATRADMKFKIDSLIAFDNNRLGLLTEDPQHEIDLNGDVNIGKILLLDGNPGQAGQVLRSNGAASPPVWANPNTIDIDTIMFKATSSVIAVNGNTASTVSSTTEVYDFGSVHNPGTGITTLPIDGVYLVTVRGSFTTNSNETGPFLLKVILEILNGNNTVAETIEETSALPGNLSAHTSNVSLHTQVQLQAGQKLRVKVSNTRPVGGVNTKLDEFSAVLL